MSEPRLICANRHASDGNRPRWRFLSGLAGDGSQYYRWRQHSTATSSDRRIDGPLTSPTPCRFTHAMPYHLRQILLTVLAILMVIGQCTPVATACGCGHSEASPDTSVSSPDKVSPAAQNGGSRSCCSQRTAVGHASSKDDARTCACGSQCGRNTVKCDCGCGEESAPEPVRPAESTDVAKVLAHGIDADSALTLAAQPATRPSRAALARPMMRRVQILLCTWQT